MAQPARESAIRSAVRRFRIESALHLVGVCIASAAYWLQIPRDIDNNHSLIAANQEKKLEHLSPLIVQ